MCQICDIKGHSAVTCFQRGCQICYRVGHTVATYFDRNQAVNPPFNSSQFFPSHPQQNQHSMHSQVLNTGITNISYNSVPAMSSQYFHHTTSSSHNPHIAMNARTQASPSAPQHEYWLLDSGAINHMTSDLSNLHIAAPYPATDTLTGANGEGLTIANFGSTNIQTKSHNFKPNFVLHVP